MKIRYKFDEYLKFYNSSTIDARYTNGEKLENSKCKRIEIINWFIIDITIITCSMYLDSISTQTILQSRTNQYVGGWKLNLTRFRRRKKKKSTRWYIYKFRNAKIYIRHKNYSQVNFIIQHFYPAFCLFFIKISERFIVKKKKCFFIHSTFIARVTINQHPINIRSNVLQLKKKNKTKNRAYTIHHRIE